MAPCACAEAACTALTTPGASYDIILAEVCLKRSLHSQSVMREAILVLDFALTRRGKNWGGLKRSNGVSVIILFIFMRVQHSWFDLVRRLDYPSVSMISHPGVDMVLRCIRMHLSAVRRAAGGLGVSNTSRSQRIIRRRATLESTLIT